MPPGARDMKIGPISIGDGARIALIAGLNVLENDEDTLASARALARLAAEHERQIVFKASFDKANRTRSDAFRGPGIERGLEMLSAVKAETGLALLTDVHGPEQAAVAADVVDCLQIPAFLCRQTDLLHACAETGRAVNVKKGQFVAPEDMRHAVDKLHGFGCDDVLVTERGTTFGYHDLVVDVRAFARMRAFAPVCFDATHAAQQPGRAGGASGGDRSVVAPLARAAVAAGIDALFIEIHPRPDEAPVDSACQLTSSDLDRLLGEIGAIEGALSDQRAD
jgi:2-dehydro-3-deoxyphosphooctonate aldolase (KDO 8-P synthase)